ncbi:MAG: hypothetical protein KME54_27685 [Tolypothrix brevis GSE-NOS-MK-07-07A]|jgi:hypothetical protein|nr:hypothetical protein [Tolypothrix brevis GSE-NOS-MK-07-07A]
MRYAAIAFFRWKQLPGFRYDSTSSFKQQKRGLMQQLLTGKKRVKLDEPRTLKVK